jgi:hypothetical protein
VSDKKLLDAVSSDNNLPPIITLSSIEIAIDRGVSSNLGIDVSLP